jgi:hypothetical protein
MHPRGCQRRRDGAALSAAATVALSIMIILYPEEAGIVQSPRWRPREAGQTGRWWM